MHLAPFPAGRQHDALDQSPDRRRRLVAVLRTVQRLGETRHFPVDLGYVEMDVRKVDRGGGQALGKLGLAGLQLAQPVRHAPHIAAIFDGGDHGGDLLLDGSGFSALACARGTTLPVEPFERDVADTTKSKPYTANRMPIGHKNAKKGCEGPRRSRYTRNEFRHLP